MMQKGLKDILKVFEWIKRLIKKLTSIKMIEISLNRNFF